MKSRTTLALLLIAAALVIYYLAVERHRPTTEQREAERYMLFAGEQFSDGFGADRRTLSALVDALTISRGDETVALERGDGGWRITRPRPMRADAGRVAGILQDLENLTIQSDVKPQANEALDLARYGLDKPRLRLTLRVARSGAAPREFSLLVGAATPAGNSVYARRADEERVVVIGAPLLDRLSPGLDELRDKAVVHVQPAQVDAFDIDSYDGQRLRCEQRRGRWWLTAPVTDLAAGAAVGALLERLAGLRLTKDDFVDNTGGDLHRFSLDQPLLTLTLHAGDDQQRLLIGGEAAGGRMYACRGGEPDVFMIDRRDAAALAVAPANLREKRVLSFAPERVRRIAMQTPVGPVSLAAGEGAWTMQQPASRIADGHRVEECLHDLAKLEVTHWIDKPGDLSDYGLDRPLATIELGLDGGDTRKLLVGAPTPDRRAVYVRRGEGGPVLQAPAEFLAQLGRGYLNFLSRQVLVFDRKALESLTIERADETVALVRDMDGWRLRRPVDAPADAAAMDDLLWDISFIQAGEYVAEKPADIALYGLDQPWLKATLVYAEDEKGGDLADARRHTVTLLVGRAAGNNYRFAMLAGGDLVFTVGASLVHQLGGEFASRQVCSFAAAAVRAITFQYGDAVTRLARDQGFWRMTEPESRADATAPANEAVAAAADLRAARVAAYRVDDPGRYGLDHLQAVVTFDLPSAQHRITIGKRQGDLYYVTSADSTFLYLVAADTVAHLMQGRPRNDAAPRKETP